MPREEAPDPAWSRPSDPEDADEGDGRRPRSRNTASVASRLVPGDADPIAGIDERPQAVHGVGIQVVAAEADRVASAWVGPRPAPAGRASGRSRANGARWSLAAVDGGAQHGEEGQRGSCRARRPRPSTPGSRRRASHRRRRRPPGPSSRQPSCLAPAQGGTGEGAGENGSERTRTCVSERAHPATHAGAVMRRRYRERSCQLMPPSGAPGSFWGCSPVRRSICSTPRR